MHVPYHPQSSGQVERMNSSEKLTKTMMTTSLKWPDALPIALYSIQSALNATTGQSPHEVLIGRPIFTGASPSSHPKKGPCFTDEYVTILRNSHF